MSLFLTLEGPEGSGKSTQAPRVAQLLRDRGWNTLLSREPGGTLIGDQIRNVLHDLANTAMHPRTEALLYSASRAQIVSEVIKPQLTSGGAVVCDRYFHSTLAYQGYGQRLDLGALRGITAFATEGLLPDWILLLDLPVEIGLDRRRGGGGEWNRLDAYELAFHQRVREGYLALAREEPGRWCIIQAGRTSEQVWEEIREKLQAWLDRR
ncbi:MAG: dTMP kinase [Anaerolineales bacterium]